MKRPVLSPEWLKFQRSRYSDFKARGLLDYLAWDIAMAEAKLRQKLARKIGKKMARAALLTCVEENKKLRFVMMGDLHTLSDVQRAKIDQLMAGGAL